MVPRGKVNNSCFPKDCIFTKQRIPPPISGGGGGVFGGVAVGLFLNFSAVGADKRKLTSSNCS